MAGRADEMLAVTRWAHNGTSWVSLHGVLTPATVRAIVRVLRSEDRAEAVVINAGGLTSVDPLCWSDLRAVCAAVAQRGVSLEWVDLPVDRRKDSAGNGG